MSDYQFTYEPTQHHMLIKINKTQFEAEAISEFKTLLNSHWRPEARSATIDCAAVEFIDSSGIGALLSIQKRMQHEGKRLRLINAQQTVIEVIELLRLNSIFQIDPNTLN